MHTDTHHVNRWAVLLALAGICLAVVVYAATADVVWAVVPLLLTVAAVRRVLRHARPR